VAIDVAAPAGVGRGAHAHGGVALRGLFLEPLALRDVARLCIPTMVLTGARTVRVMRRMADTLRGAMHARHREIADAGHMGPITHAEVVDRAVHAFVAGSERIAA
jgi:pimeloyl-ACP methyl ester carboxylesterase